MATENNPKQAEELVADAARDRATLKALGAMVAEMNKTMEPRSPFAEMNKTMEPRSPFSPYPSPVVFRTHCKGEEISLECLAGEEPAGYRSRVAEIAYSKGLDEGARRTLKTTGEQAAEWLLDYAYDHARQSRTHLCTAALLLSKAVADAATLPEVFQKIQAEIPQWVYHKLDAEVFKAAIEITSALSHRFDYESRKDLQQRFDAGEI
jgi:hypothetical protein